APVSCIPAGGPSAEVTLGALDVPLAWAGVDGSQTVSVEARWNLNKGDVYGVGGSITVGGSSDFKGVTMNGFTAAAAFGQFENYFVARGSGGGKSSSGGAGNAGVGFSADIGLFAGHSCKPDPLLLADPLAAELIQPPESFKGVYLNYGGKVPLT